MKNLYKNIETDVALRLRTLNYIRWIAVSGQILASCIAYFYFEILFNINLAIFLIVLSAILNIFSLIQFERTKVLNFNELTQYLLFDLLQLVCLLYLTGGLTNPFCILILAPIVISATYLDLQRAIFICASSIASISFLLFYYIPIQSSFVNYSSYDFSSFEILSIWASLLVTLIFISSYCFRIANESRKIVNALQKTQIALLNEEKISDLMSLTAAAVHELGTPLSTISIISKELVDGIENDHNNYDDLKIINNQIKRCADILNRLRSNSFAEKSDDFINKPSFTILINEILDNYSNEKILVKFNIDKSFDKEKIRVSRAPEIVQSLSNVIDNAFKYAKEKIIINLSNLENQILIEITDDGDGFSNEIFSLLGDPYVKKSIDKEDTGLGLGLFISKNLINRSFGDIKFLNSAKYGACVQITLEKKALKIH